MEDYLAALEELTLLKDLLANDDWERLFRVGLRSKDEKLLAYLSAKPVLSDMIQAIVNEEGKLNLVTTLTFRTILARSFRITGCSSLQPRTLECTNKEYSVIIISRMPLWQIISLHSSVTWTEKS